MITEHSGGMAANEFERIERMRLQQEIARLEQEELTLQRGFCPFSNLRVEECANHSDHLRPLEAHQVDLQRLYKESKEYDA